MEHRQHDQPIGANSEENRVRKATHANTTHVGQHLWESLGHFTGLLEGSFNLGNELGPKP